MGVEARRYVDFIDIINHGTLLGSSYIILNTTRWLLFQKKKKKKKKKEKEFKISSCELQRVKYRYFEIKRTWREKFETLLLNSRKECICEVERGNKFACDEIRGIIARFSSKQDRQRYFSKFFIILWNEPTSPITSLRTTKKFRGHTVGYKGIAKIRRANK